MAARSKEESLGSPSSSETTGAPFAASSSSSCAQQLSTVSSSSFLLAIQLGRGRILGDVGGIKELVHGGDGGAYTIPNVVGFKKSLYVLQSKGAANATERNMATTTAFRLSGSASTSTSSSSIFFENVVVASWLGC